MKIKFYKNVSISQLQNKIVEDIETYLSSFSSRTHTLGERPFKTSVLDLEIKIATNALVFKEFVELWNETDKWNYCKLFDNENNDALIGYYYITGYEKLADRVVKFILRLDVLNSIEIKPYISDQTQIIREHQDRWEVSGGAYYPIIDKESEDIQSPLQLTQDSIQWDLDMNFYLVYMTGDLDVENLDRPLTCYICADADLFISSGVTQKTLTPSDLDSNYYYFIRYEENHLAQATINGTSYSLNAHEGFVYYLDGGNIKFSKVTFTTQGAYSSSTTLTSSASLTLRNLDEGYKRSTSSFVNMNQLTEGYLLDGQSILIGANGDTYIQGISHFNRSDSRLVKIICLPYCPSNDLMYDSATDSWTYDPNVFAYKEGRLYLKYLNYEFARDVEIDNPYQEMRRTTFASIEDISTEEWEIEPYDYEPKMMSSQIEQKRMVYDSTSYLFRLEQFKNTTSARLNLPYTPKCECKFYPTNTCNSKFAFNFEDERHFELFDSYPGWMIIARNNEEVIYNNAYINYIKTGYNYDIKNKERDNLNAWLGLGASALGTGASIVTGNPLSIGMATSSAMNLISTIQSVQRNEEQLQRTQAQLKASPTSVIGADDIDLLKKYNGNKLHLQTWRISERMRFLCAKLFHLYGYASNRIGIPHWSNRHRFNYIQCDLKFNLSGLTRYPLEIREEIIRLFAEGVTIIHHNASDRYPYDVEQRYQNMEEDLF